VLLLARASALGVALVVVALIVVQFAKIIGRDLAYAHAVHNVEREIAALEHKRIEQQQEIRRLSDPRGAIPEIHDRLHLVGDHQTIIYLRPHG
jgi:cell division protein FtsB